MTKIFYRFIFSFSLMINLIFTEFISHEPAEEPLFDEPFEIQIFTDYADEAVNTVELYFKTDDQIVYLQKTLNKTSEDYYGITLPGELIVGDYIEYYILFNLVDGKYITYPEIDPHINPITLKVNKKMQTNLSNNQGSLLIPEYEILTPKHNQKLLSNNLVVSLSYFKIADLDLAEVKIFIDDVDMTLSSNIRKSNLFLIPSKLKEGKHEIKVLLKNNNGQIYSPIVWNFYSYDKESSLSQFTASGKLWNSYTNNEIDGDIASNNTTNLNFKINSDVFDIKGKIKKSSLENELYQATDRYYLKVDLDEFFNVELGDFYPKMGTFILGGNRVRGIGLDLGLKFFQLNIIKGELARAVQGNPLNGGIHISDFTDNTVSISRSGYTFKRDVSGLRIGLGPVDRLNFGLNLLKVKDDIGSVNQRLSDAFITIPLSEPFDNLISDQCIDFEGDGECVNDGYLLIDNNGNGSFDPEVPSIVPTNVYSSEHFCTDDTIQVDDCADYSNPANCNNGNIYSLYQCYWEVVVEEDNLDEFLSDNNYEATDGGDIVVVNLEDQWSDEAPKDNINIGTDMSFASKNGNLKFNTSIEMSLLNENIWNPVASLNDLDVFEDNHYDGYMGRTYNESSFCNGGGCNEGNNCTNDDGTGAGTCDDGDYYWMDYIAWIYDSTGVDVPVENLPAKVLEGGISLNDIPNPEDFEDIYHWNTDSTPLIPFYSIFQSIEGSCNYGDCSDGTIGLEQNCEQTWTAFPDENECRANGGSWNDEVKFSDILNQPEIAYNMDFSLKLNKHQFQFGVKKVGSEFNSLGNSYLQKDMLEKYFVDRVRLLDNKMYIMIKVRKIKNGLSDVIASSYTDKYDVNLNYYPGIGLPSISVSGARYFRESGSGSMTWAEFLSDCDEDNNGIADDDCYDSWSFLDDDESGIIEEEEFDLVDSRSHTRTDNYNIGINHRFKYKGKNQNLNFNYFHSTKIDLLYDELSDDEDYVSPRSLNKNMGLNLTTYLRKNLNTRMNYSTSSYNYGNENSDYYQDQKIEKIGFGVYYNTDNLIDKLGATVSYSNATGTNEYNQTGLKVFSNLSFMNNILLNLSYNYNKKTQESEKYYNSIFKANLSYKF